MKLIRFLSGLCIILLIASCRDAATKAEHDNNNESTDTQKTAAPADTPATDAKLSAPVSSTVTNEILENIDRYLVSTTSFDPVPAGKEGINNGIVTLENKMDNTSFQKVYLEVSIRLADSSEFRSDYYVLVNIRPGDSKQVRIPRSARGTTIISHVVKIRSDELTNGELKLTGSRTALNK